MAAAAGGCKSAGKCVTALLYWGKLDKRGVGWIKDMLDEGGPPGNEVILSQVDLVVYLCSENIIIL